MDTVVLCYHKNPGNIPDYEEVQYDSLEDWKTQHPDCIITHIFAAKYNLANYDSNLKNEFLNRCQEYGMQPDALSKQYIDNKGNKYHFLGLQPKNTKYKFVIRHIGNGRRFKVSYSFMKSLAPLSPAGGGN